MNIVLWILQVALAGLYAIAGVTKLVAFDQFAQQVASAQALPAAAWMAIGLFEILCAVGLTLPAATRIRPALTVFAAASLAVEGVAFAALHGLYGERSPMLYGMVLAAVAGFVAWGRLALRPLAPRPA